jgi:hypothetical protein
MSIGGRAFYACLKLVKASFPKVTSIGESAFYACHKLAEASFPEATDIGTYAFAGCSELVSVSIPKATSIGAFSYTGTTGLTVTLGSTAPTLGRTMFEDVTNAKTVTVKVPSSETVWTGKTGTYSGADNTANWGNGFRGGSWTGSAFQSDGSVNSNITLTIKTQ